MSDTATLEDIKDVRIEVNGLGGRISELALKHEYCSGRTCERLRYVEEADKEKGEQIVRIFQGQETANVQLGQLKTILKIWGSIIGIGTPVIASMVGAVVAVIMGKG